MNINEINTPKVPLMKMLSNLEGYVDKVYSQKAIQQKQFACDLFLTGKTCNTSEKENLMNNFLVTLADKMISAKQENLSSIIYSFLIKFNKDNLIVLKQLIPKALEIAKMQKDSVHVAARAGELCDIYKAYQIHGSNYLTCLYLRKKALNDICANYDTAGERFKTISRQINNKDRYIELLIRTKCDIANELIITNKQEARKELLSAYRDFSKLSEDYKITHDKTYCGLKKYISTKLTNITLCKNTTEVNDILAQFYQIRKNIIEATKENAPIENSIFDECFASMYDKSKTNSLENKFLSKSMELVDELENLGHPFLADRICNVLAGKNQDNIQNLKTVILKQMELREKEQDYFGIMYFSAHIQRLFKKNPKAVSINSYLKTLQMNIKAITNIIENYDNYSKKRSVKPKEEYIKQLIFSKGNSARLQRNTYPEYTQIAIKEISKLINELPQKYIDEHPEMDIVLQFVRQNKK